MPELWIPGAQVVNRASMGLSLTTGPAVAVWHTTETPKGSAGAVARGDNMARWPAHLVWDPYTGELFQLLPANLAGRALVTHNRDGKAVIQIESVGYAQDAPLSTSPMKGLPAILAWLDSWGVPRSWPAGAPLPYPQSYGAGNGQRGHWGASGHYGHSQVPENDHGDPGMVDVAKWAKPATGSAPPSVYPEPPLGYELWNGSTDPVQGKYSFVHWMQSRLVARGQRVAVDGDFGPATESALKAFQASHDLVADGVFGRSTQLKLRG